MNAPARLCLIEDDPIMGESLCDRFELEGFGCHWFRQTGEARSALVEQEYAAVISDIRLPDGQGDELFLSLAEQGVPLPPWLFITAYGSVDRAVTVLKSGATDYITKPFDLDALIDKLRILVGPMDKEGEAAGALGVSPTMRRIGRLLPRLAAQAGTILITGESGVGKEAVAREIHRLDPASSDRPFIAVNCGGLTESLLEAELFGHEKGAFTGAVRARPGVFEQADGGTLFLDEVGDMPLVMQVKLLRAIQERQVVRVGGEQPISVNLRLICATHRDLRALVDEGRFREDLYYRIHVIHLRLPPLRERRDDIPWLVRQFLEAFVRATGERKQLPPETEHALMRHDWPGNIRELKHAIERACILSPGETLTREALLDEPLITEGEEGTAGATWTLSEHLQSCERAYIVGALEANGGHVARTAESLGISRKNLWERMKRLGL
ncbi:MAG: sigma-54-dependent Fis family transcriptional regulator [Chromatiaceae bacterium]|nr:MAG: sigma-54-dependent Fis family transcriptional regulator [Chromatiaceae bacterium]